MDSSLPPHDGTKQAPLWTLTPNLGRLLFFVNIFFVCFVLTVLTNFLSAAVDSWPFQLDCGRGAIVSNALFFDKRAFERWICSRKATSDFPASSNTPITPLVKAEFLGPSSCASESEISDTFFSFLFLLFTNYIKLTYFKGDKIPGKDVGQSGDWTVVDQHLLYLLLFCVVFSCIKTFF